MEIWQTLSRLFEKHAPETLMALFGAGTSILLFYLVWTVLRHWLGWQSRREGWEAYQDRATAALVEALVGALVTEAGHLRTTLDSILEEALRRSEQHTQLLAALSVQAEEAPEKTLALLRPEFDHLRRELRQAEVRIIAKMALRTDAAEGAGERDEEVPGPLVGT